MWPGSSLSNPAQVVKALIEAEAYDGPSLIIAYSHCIAHGIDMTTGVDDCKKAVASGYWPLYRYNPAPGRRRARTRCSWTARPRRIAFEEYANSENRFRVLKKTNPEAGRCS